jgi:hypothetical protein
LNIANPCLDDFRKHARLFGDEGVYGVATNYLAGEDLARLRVEIDEARANERGRYGTVIGKRRKRSADETAKLALRLSMDGLVPAAISEKLGISDSYARKLVKA